MGSSIGGLGSGSRRDGKKKSSYHRDEDSDSSENEDEHEFFDPYNNKKDQNKNSRYTIRNNETPNSQ